MLEQRHFGLAHQEMVFELKRVFRLVLNKESLEATYNTCVALKSTDKEHVEWHSDTLSDLETSPYIEGAAFFVVMKGMRQLLSTRGLLSCNPRGEKVYDFPTTGVPCIELEDGCAYMFPAGAKGSVDWLVEHMTSAHPDGPGEAWEGEEKPERWSWVVRAVKPEHAQWYNNQSWPY